MTRAWRALIIAPDDFPGEYDDYVAACRELKLEPNGHCYLVCLVSTADRPRTVLTVDLSVLPEVDEAGTSDQASLPGADRSTEAASRAGPPYHPLWAAARYRGGDQDLPGRGPDPEESGPVLPSWGVRLSPPIPAPPSQELNPFLRFCEPAQQHNRPHVQLVLDLDRATLKGLAVWNPTNENLVKAAFRETFADTAAQVVIDRLWPPHTPPSGLADLDTAITVLQAGLEPQTLLLKMINAAARVAAAHAGFGVAAPLVGQFAEDLCKQFVRPPTPTDEIMVNVLSSIDIDLYAAADKLADCAPLRELTVQETSLGVEKLFKVRFGVDTPMRAPGPGGLSPDSRDRDPGGLSPVLQGRQSASMSAVGFAGLPPRGCCTFLLHLSGESGPGHPSDWRRIEPRQDHSRRALSGPVPPASRALPPVASLRDPKPRS